jgi:hypothetical protein
MLRRIAYITAMLVVTSSGLGCSSADPGAEASRSTAQSVTAGGAAVAGPQCHHGGGPRTIQIWSFDATSMELTGITFDGQYVDVWITSATAPVLANVRLYPPDPIFPQCKNDATTWNGDIGDGLTSTVLADLAQLANDGCDASIAIGFDGSVTSVQPVP